jgi:predicted nucleic acid-binding protein
MQVVSNTSPINYPLQIDSIGILQDLYGEIIVPHAVIAELSNVESPSVVRNWAARPPDWVDVRTPTREAGWQLTHLGAGEKDAILLAEDIGANLLIIDERAGFTEAKNRGLLATGTLGVLERAADLGLISLTEIVSRLLATNFRIRRDVVETLLKRHELS